MQISVNIEIDAAPEKIWQAITDFQNSTAMISAIKSIEILEQPKEGLVGFKWAEIREIFGKDAKEVMTISHCVEQEYYQTRAENHGAVYISRLEISQNEGQHFLTMSFNSQADSWWLNVLTKLMSVFIKKSMIKMIKQDLQDIKLYCEK